jgi:2-polyprenyl-3-methyl-5-hydroxy-6-metoxy-1,4-benzoquinol methylase
VADSTGPALVVTSVADLALVQGLRPASCPPADAVIELDIDGGPATVPITRWFPVPGRSGGEPIAFAVTFDDADLVGAERCRIRCGDRRGDWVALPTLRTPRGMPGVEIVAECPACASSQRTVVGRRQGLTMERCRECGLVMTSPRPAEDKTLVRYSRDYFEGEYLPTQRDTPALRAHNDALLDALTTHHRSEASLFELGVGGGLFLDRATERGWMVHGTDVNPAAVDHVRSRGHDAWVDNIDHAETIGGPYTAVVSEMSLEHVRRPDHFVELATAALEPGGALLIYTVSCEGDSFRHAGMASYLVGPAEHLFLFTTRALVTLCQAHGLEVEHTWTSASGDDVGVVAVKASTTA